MAKNSVEEALERVLTRNNSSVCWARAIKEGTEAHEFLKGLEALGDDNVHVVTPRAAEEFVSFGVEVSKEQVGRHLRRVCKCR